MSQRFCFSRFSAVAVCVGAILSAAAARAQDAAPPAPAGDAATASGGLEEVVVSGYRMSLQNALEIKRLSDVMVDAIKAEDIAKFPDSNLAESLQRLPGIAIDRDAGEGRSITVRGLGSDFTRVRLNGLETLSTGAASDSGGAPNRSRGFDFNIFASDLFSKLEVRKTASANTDEGSLGATVDLRTARPFDFKEFTMVAGVKGAWNDLQGDTDPRATFLVSNTFGDGHFGVLFSAAYAERSLIEEGQSTVRWDLGSSSGGFNAASAPTGVTMAQVNAAFNPRIPRYGRLTHDQDRLGLTGALQWQPNDANLINLDLLYSDFNAKRDENFLEAFSFSRTAAQGGKPQTLVRQGEIDGNGTLVYGLFDDVDIRSESRHDELETIFYSAALSASHQLSEQWSIDETLGYSRSDFNNPIQTTVTLDRSNSDGYSYDYRDSSRLPSYNYNFDPTNPANWGFQSFGGGLSSEIRLRPQGVDNTFQVAKIDLNFAPTDSWKFKFGLDYKKYNFVSWEQRRASETTVPVLPAGTTVADLTRVLSGFGDGMDMPSGTPTAWLIPDLAAFEQTFDIYSRTGIFALGDINNASARGNNRNVEEEDQGAFVQASFSMDWGIPVRGDFGVRYVKTDMTSQGYSTTAALVTAGNDYSDVLPSLNFVADVTDDLLVRFGAAKVMTRPALGSVTPGITNISLVGNLGVSAGNPTLDPIRAKTYEIKVPFNEATQLAEQSDVRISGVNVGKVQKIELAPNGRQALATAAIDDRYAPLPASTRAILRTKTLLGETYIELTPGSREGKQLEDGGTLPEANVAESVQLDEIFRTFNAQTRAAFQHWMQEAAVAINGQGENLSYALGGLEPTFTEFDKLFRVLDSQRLAVGQLFRNGATSAVNAAATTKNASNPMKIQDIPLMRRFLFGVAAGAKGPAASIAVKPPSSEVRRNPQFRQKRSSEGMAEWQFEQIV